MQRDSPLASGNFTKNCSEVKFPPRGHRSFLMSRLGFGFLLWNPLGWAIEDERFVLCGLTEDHVLARRYPGHLLYLGFRDFKTFCCGLPHVRSILHFENV